MDSADPFGTAAKAKVFDPDAPIARTAAAAQWADAFPPEHEQPEEEQPASAPEQPKPRVAPKSPSKSAEDKADSVAEPKPKPARPRFVRPKMAAAKKEDDAEIFIAVAEPKGKAPTSAQEAEEKEEETKPSASVAAPSAPAPSAAPASSAAALDDLPVGGARNKSLSSSPFDNPDPFNTGAAAPPAAAGGSVDLSSDDPFGAGKKKAPFDPDAPLVRTAAASMMSEYPEGRSRPPTRHRCPSPRLSLR